MKKNHRTHLFSSRGHKKCQIKKQDLAGEEPLGFSGRDLPTPSSKTLLH